MVTVPLRAVFQPRRTCRIGMGIFSWHSSEHIHHLDVKWGEVWWRWVFTGSSVLLAVVGSSMI
jgi:hypothetical protein